MKRRASATSRWLNCTASVELCENIESKSSSYADEGTKAHAVCEKALLTGVIETDDLEMAAGAMMYLEFINELRKTKVLEMVEQRFFSSIEGLSGQIDCCIFIPRCAALG